MSFLVVYIREAHPEEGWVLPENRRSGLAVHEPTTLDERRAVAGVCVANLKIGMPAVLDGLDNAVAAIYGGWPDRLYLVDTDCRIAWQSGEGPFGFEPQELARAIDETLAARSERLG